MFPTVLKRINREKISKHLRLAYQSGYRWVKYAPNTSKQVLFIFGCQRSGTTIMQEVFSRDMSAKTYLEQSCLSSADPKGLRLNPLADVRRILESDRAELLVLKPLVESQNAVRLMNFFPDSKALWMYRDYRDVVASKVKKSGHMGCVYNAQKIAESADNWHAENVPERVQSTVAKYFSLDMSPYDAAALYWYTRNSLFFDQKLEEHPRVILCRYEQFTRDPLTNTEEIYRFVGRPFPGSDIVADVHGSSVRKGGHVELFPDIISLCDEMQNRLNEALQKQQVS